MKIGFTGTRQGTTPDQLATVRFLIGLLMPDEFHHGAAKGADAEAAMAARDTVELSDFRVCAWPGIDGSGKSPDEDAGSIDYANWVMEPARYFVRNRAIVDATDLLIACPPCWPLPASGGTLYTINYARKVGKPVLIVDPAGDVHPIIPGK